MLSLFYSRLHRLFKAKSTYIILAIACLMPLFSGLVNIGVSSSMGDLMGDIPLDLGSAQGHCSAYVDVASNTNILIIILVAIFSGGMMSEGVVRNIIMAGKTRTQIFFSEAMSAVLIVFMLVTPTILIDVLFTGFTLGWGTGTATQLLVSYFTSYGLSLLVGVLAAMFTLMFVFMFKKKSAPMICGIVVTSLAGGILASWVAVDFMLSAVPDYNAIGVEVWSWIPIAQCYLYTVLGMTDDWQLIGKIVLMTVAIASALGLLGWNAIKKSDIN